MCECQTNQTSNFHNQAYDDANKDSSVEAHTTTKFKLLSQTVVNAVWRYSAVVVPHRYIPSIPDAEVERSVDTVFVKYGGSAIGVNPVDGLHVFVLWSCSHLRK
jgi:hypothetical protein